MPTERVSVRLDKQLRRQLKKLSRELHKKESELVREALQAYCAATTTSRAEGPTCYDLALRAGFIGSAKNLPPDLSTNPKYMEGFGKS